MLAPIFDTHCHYNLEPLNSDWRSHWAAAREAGVIASMIVGTDTASSITACQIAASDENLFASFGIHPTAAGATAEEVTPEWLRAEIEKTATIGPIAAIGETGLDYYRLTGTDAQLAKSKQLQKRSLISHLVIAKELALPTLIHVRDTGEVAYHDMAQVLKEYAQSQTVVMHCFSGPEWYLDTVLELGCYISFAGNITYPSAENLRQLAQKVPKDRILVETDAPFLPPQSHRGQVCEPRYITETATVLCALLEIEPQDLLNNAQRIFTTIPSHL